MRRGEFQIIDRFFTHDAFGEWRSQGVGDDCAIIDMPGNRIAVTTDMMAVGTHFLPGARPEDIGYKALAVNLSDLAAAGASPRAFFLSIGLPERDDEWLAGFSRGLMALAESFMISADNAHALHPNYTDKADPVNRPVMNGGIVIKYNANQKYCTDGISTAIFKELCREADVPYQTFVNRSDIAGGSTLGNISNTQAAINTVDIGLPQLAMHSAYETAGVKDTESLIRAAKVFYR